MSDDLTKVADRVRQKTAAAADTVDAHATPGTRPRASRAGMFIAGDRVFDPLTGAAGVVVSVTSAGRAAIGTVGVRLDDGRSVTRKPSELYARPTPPAGSGATA